MYKGQDFKQTNELEFGEDVIKAGAREYFNYGDTIINGSG